MRILKNKWFAKFARKEGISDAKLCKAMNDVEAGKIDVDYGGGVIKQRIARPNEGKSGGYRSASYTTETTGLSSSMGSQKMNGKT